MRIIPAIDIIDGKCVRLTKGDYDQKKVYNNDPVEVAKTFEDHGLKYLHVVDLDGAKSKQIINYKSLEKICHQTELKVDFGGGIKSKNDLQIAFDCGVNQVTCGSIAVNQPDLFLSFLEDFGANRIILGADCIHRKIATLGWKETDNIDVLDFIKNYEDKGIKYVVCTDISKDGMLDGPSIDLYKEILDHSSIKLIASGGVSSIDDISQLKAIHCEGVIIGKAIYENKISLSELSSLC